MDEQSTKTSVKQRILIIVITVALLGSIIASYIAIIVSNNNARSEASSDVDSELVEELTAEYQAKAAEVDAAAADLSAQYYDVFAPYKSNVVAYNETSANSGGLQTADLKEGDGRTLGEGDTDYFAYYIGWCSDETIFDSNLQDTSLASPLSGSSSMIQGWLDGIVGMKMGGVRELTIPGELAYGDKTEMCGGYNKPLKFVVMTVEPTEPMATLLDELDTLYMKLLYAQNGLDYDSIMNAGTTE